MGKFLTFRDRKINCVNPPYIPKSLSIFYTYSAFYYVEKVFNSAYDFNIPRKFSFFGIYLCCTEEIEFCQHISFLNLLSIV